MRRIECAVARLAITLNPAAYITVDFKKLARDLFYPGSALVETESIKKKTWLLE